MITRDDSLAALRQMIRQVESGAILVVSCELVCERADFVEVNGWMVPSLRRFVMKFKHSAVPDSTTHLQ